MPNTLEGKLSAEGLKLGVVVSRFNALVTDRLLTAALDCLARHGAREADIDVVRVPGAWEIPVACRWLAEQKGRYDALVAIGCVIRGGTPHFEYVAGESTAGAARVSLDTGVPVALGILTADTVEQALDRAGGKHGNKGWDAALTAIEMASLRRSLRG